MNAITLQTPATTQTPAADLTAQLFIDFVAFIDRGEKTTRTYLNNLRQFMAWMKYRAVNRPTRQDVIAYRDYLATEHDAITLNPAAPEGWTYRTDSHGNRVTISCKPNTVKQYLQSVRQFFSWTAANGLYPDIAANIHAPKIRQDRHKKDALTPADVLTIEEHIKTASQAATAAAGQQAKDTAGRISRATEQGRRLYAMYMLAVNAGLRTVELSRANVKDIEIRDGAASILIWGKGHTEPDQKKPLAPAVYQAIRDYLDNRADRATGSAPLFVATGNRSGGQRLAPTTISTMLKKAMQAAGFDSEKLTAHSLRHTAGTNVMQLSGNNLFITQQYMRHESPATTETYLHIDTEKQEADIAQRLYDRYHGTDRAADPSGDLGQLSGILQGLTADQLTHIAGIAAALAQTPAARA